MAEQAEVAFIKTYLNTLTTQTVIYADDYQQPPENSLRKVPILPIPLPDPPRREAVSSSSPASINITIKSLKPHKSFTLSVTQTDTIADIKAHLASQPFAPPVDTQRLLLKGKALVDGKLLREYAVKEGDTLNLMVRPGYDWDPTTPTPVTTATSSQTTPQMNLNPENKLSTLSPLRTPEATPTKRQGHQRIPSLVLSPSPNASPSAEKPLDIALTLDSTAIPASPVAALMTSFHDVVCEPAYWARMKTFVEAEFKNSDDARIAFEDYLAASKGSMTANEIAKIRDELGIIGMAGQ